MNGILRTTGHLFREARRRKVFRTAALYIVGAWLALQVANTLFPGFGIPDIAIRALSPAVNDPTTAVQVLGAVEDVPATTCPSCPPARVFPVKAR